MTSQDAYFRQLAKLRKVLDETAVLPGYLLPESQDITNETRELARRAREAVLRGDLACLRESSAGLAAAGFDRNADVDIESLPELEIAREKLNERRRRRGNDERPQGELDCSSDPEG